MTKEPAPYGLAPHSDFESQFRRVFEAAECRTQIELATLLEIRQSAISDAKRRKSVPPEWIVKLFSKKQINPNWLRTGKGEMIAEGSPVGIDHDVIDMERKASELTSLMFALSEKRIMAHRGMPAPELRALAAFALSLQEAAQTLLSFAAPPDEPLQDESKGATQQDEYRSYRVPFHVLNEEQTLLDEYDTGKIADVFQYIYMEFSLMLELMKAYSERNDNEDFTYSLLAQQLLKPLKRFNKACLVLADFELQPQEPGQES